MQRQRLALYETTSKGMFRTVIKNRHGRLIYLQLSVSGKRCNIIECYYIDRFKGGKYYAAPKMLVTRSFPYDRLLAVVAAELDRTFYGIEVDNSCRSLSTDDFIDYQLKSLRHKYNFLIFITEGEAANGIPSVLRTRFKNRIHRAIYLELRHYKDNMGVVADCHYYDRQYKARKSVTPEALSSVFFDYTRDGILSLVNSELNTDFTDIIFTDSSCVDITHKIALCGNI